MKVKDEGEKVGLKLNVQKTKIMASGPITSWQIDGKHITSEFYSKIMKTTLGSTSHVLFRARDASQEIRQQPSAEEGQTILAFQKLSSGCLWA